MIRAYVVDDEPLAVQRLTRLLETTGRVAVAGSSTDPEAALHWLRANSVDVLVLDIQMPGLTGFDLLEQLGGDLPVVFTTAYDRYAIEAFEVNSIAYLLKPIEPERLARALDKLEHTVTQRRDADVGALARALASQLTSGRRVERLASRVGGRTMLLDVGRITHFVARDKLTYAAVSGGERVVDETLNELDRKLDPRRFLRIHRSTIVNLAFVQELFPGVDGGMLIRLRDEARTELTVARDRVRDLKERLGI